jgi:hypothetical protein
VKARGTRRALGAAPIVAGCAVICGLPTTSVALTRAPSRSATASFEAVGARADVLFPRGPSHQQPEPIGHSVFVDQHRRPVTVERHPRPVAAKPLITPRFSLNPLALNVETGQVMTLYGRLLPAAAGETVHLVGQAAGRWTTLASAQTGRAGGFALRYALMRAGSTPLRVSFTGRPGSRSAAANVGSVVALAPTVASWYYDGGSTACGFHAFYGVANKTLPCGTKVAIRYGSRSVIATVDDRGPYVYGRDFDLNQNISSALGMFGVATVLASVV